jgi:Zn-finger nucleic acid-binding protein
MIYCKKCSFEVKASMRHAIRKNFCPACGNALLGDFQMGKIALIKEKILAQEFSKDLNSDLIFDLSLFIVSEFTKNTTSKAEVLEETEGETETVEVSEESEDLEPVRKREVTKSGGARVLDEIRTQVRSEVMSDLDDEEFDEDDESALKIARLKRIAQENKVGKSGAIVRRISD